MLKSHYERSFVLIHRYLFYPRCLPFPEIVPLLVAVVKCALAAGGGGRRVSTSSPPGNGPQQLATTTTSVAYIATKVRNEATLELFLTTCSTSGLVVEDITSAAVAATSVGVRFLHNSVLPNDDVRFAVVLHRITLS